MPLLRISSKFVYIWYCFPKFHYIICCIVLMHFFYLINNRGTRIHCTLWSDFAVRMQQYLDNHDPAQPLIIVFQHYKLKKYLGRQLPHFDLKFGWCLKKKTIVTLSLTWIRCNGYIQFFLWIQAVFEWWSSWDCSICWKVILVQHFIWI
jgi:hypothetical protein